MSLRYGKVHNELYLVQDSEGNTVGELDRESGDWQVTYKGRKVDNVRIVNLRDAKKFIENMALSELVPEPFDEGC
jgi:hypothetical protein